MFCCCCCFHCASVSLSFVPVDLSETKYACNRQLNMEMNMLLYTRGSGSSSDKAEASVGLRYYYTCS